MIDAALLDRVELFGGLDAGARREIAARGRLLRLAPDQVLWTAGSPARWLCVALEGEVRVVRATGGRQHVIHTEGPGGTLGEVPLFAGGTYPATAVAARRTVCLALGPEALEAAIREDPRLAFALLGRLAARVRGLVERLDERVARPVRARVCAHLLARWRAAGENRITLGATQARVAEELGTAREVVARELGRLHADGVLERERPGVFRVLDPEELRRRAGG